MGRQVQRPSAAVIKPKGDNHEDLVFAGQDWPLSTLPPCRNGALDADAIRSRRHSERSDGRVLFPASIEGWPDHFGGNARFAPWQWLCGCARYLFGPSD